MTYGIWNISTMKVSSVKFDSLFVFFVISDYTKNRKAFNEWMESIKSIYDYNVWYYDIDRIIIKQSNKEKA